MPGASAEQVPKPLTYALMYHGLWAVLFLASWLALTVVFLSTGQGIVHGLLPPLSLLGLGLLAAGGFLVTYVARVHLLEGTVTVAEAYEMSRWSAQAVLALAPALLLLRLAAAPLARALLRIETWPLTLTLTGAVFQVELVVWWLSHLLNLNGLRRGLRREVGLAAGLAQGDADRAGSPGLFAAGRRPAGKE